ncbi:MAG: hypothetical protein Q7J47_06000 [Azoarcus sp.]|nr:hypothetical protein [Azoarcus sp.]
MTPADKLFAIAATFPLPEQEEALRIVRLGTECARRPIVFRWIEDGQPGADLFEIGREGEDLQYVRTDLFGVWWAWAAIDNPKSEADRSAAFSRPGAASPDNSIRHAIRVTAAAWLRRYSPELGSACASIAVSKGFVRYHPSASAPRILTR